MTPRPSPLFLRGTGVPARPRMAWNLTAPASKYAPGRAALQMYRQRLTRPESRSSVSKAIPSLPRPSHPPREPPDAPSSSPPPPPTARDRRAIYVASLFGFIIALSISLTYSGIRKNWERSKTLALEPNADVSDRWDTIGRNYDDEIEWAEKVMFMGRKRGRLVSQAKGKVLEVSVGTGRNMQYYDVSSWGRAGEKVYHEAMVTSLMFNDKAEVMVNTARKKFEELEGRKLAARRFKGPVELRVGDASANGVIERPSTGFDTIVQTMGLCSANDPVKLLRRLGELCKKPTAKGTANARGKMEDYDGGRILLLEHGRGSYDWLNNMLDGLAASHADHYGCWWNRDIGAIVAESGLEVEYIKRYHWGTTWEVVLRPRRDEEVAGVTEATSEKSKSNGLFGWLSEVLK